MKNRTLVIAIIFVCATIVLGCVCLGGYLLLSAGNMKSLNQQLTSVDPRIAGIATAMIQIRCEALSWDCTDVKVTSTYLAPPQDRADELNRKDAQVEELWCASMSFLQKSGTGYEDIQKQIAMKNIGGDWYLMYLGKFDVNTAGGNAREGTCADFAKFSADVLNSQLQNHLSDGWEGPYMAEQRPGNPLIGGWEGKLSEESDVLCKLVLQNRYAFFNRVYYDGSISVSGPAGTYNYTNNLVTLDGGGVPRTYTFSISEGNLVLQERQCIGSYQKVPSRFLYQVATQGEK